MASLTRPDRYRLRPLLVAGLASLVAWTELYFLLFSHTFWGAPTLIPDRWPQVFGPFEARLPWAWVHAHRDQLLGLTNAGIWLGLMAMLFAAWIWAWRAAERIPGDDPGIAREGGRIVLVGVVCFSAILVLAPSMTSSDVFSYIWYGKMAGIYQLSPFTHTPNNFAYQDTYGWLQWVYWKDQPTVYGPVWVGIAGLLARLAQALDGDIVTYLLTHRVLAAVLHLANTALVWSLAGKLGPRTAGARLAATVFYGWCPLVVWEFAGSAHNDVMMIFFILAGLWCHQRGTGSPGRNLWWQAAIGALVLAGLVKAIAFVLIPAYLLLVWRDVRGAHPWWQRAAVAAQVGGITVGLGALLYWPYWQGLATLRALLIAPGNERSINSLGDVLRFRTPEILYWLGNIFAPGQMGPWAIGVIGDSMEGWLRPLLTAVAGALVLALTWQARDTRTLVRGWGWLLVAYLLIGAMWFWPWYVTWFLPMAALLGPGRLRNAGVLYAIGGLALYALAPTLAAPLDGLEGYVPLICFGPVAAYLLRAVWQDQRAKRPILAAGAPAMPAYSRPPIAPRRLGRAGSAPVTD
ncbi:MAG TPA: hypothetical protein VM536_19155 [Chloroflexia bacterium]|nr:hypothetical protein [Chloroflexia bacterium]